MKSLGLALLTVMAVGCHFDKLFNANGGSQAQSGGTAPAATHLIFATQPTNSSAGATISPPVRVAAMDDRGDTVTTFHGTAAMAIQRDGSALGGARLSGTTTNVPFVNGIATFPDLRIDQPGLAAYTLKARNGELSDVESGSFYVGP